jgi:CDP-diacylglycerol--glycerol-3-phosphate 3-phosphatidyltransferase
VNYTIANMLTVSRFFIAPVMLVCVLANTAEGMHWAVVLFTVGALTDYFDGALARRMGEETTLGSFLDPLADKALTTSAFTAFYMLDVIPLWVLIVIVVRDFGTTVLRSVKSSTLRPLKTSRTAKWKTFLQMCFIIYALVLQWAVHSAPTATLRTTAWNQLHAESTYWVMVGITLFTLYTAVEYLFLQYRKH